MTASCLHQRRLCGGGKREQGPPSSPPAWPWPSLELGNEEKHRQSPIMVKANISAFTEGQNRPKSRASAQGPRTNQTARKTTPGPTAKPGSQPLHGSPEHIPSRRQPTGFRDTSHTLRNLPREKATINTGCILSRVRPVLRS